MRIVRLLGVVLTMLTAGLLLATPAGAQPPSDLNEHITDSSKVLTDSQRATVSSVIDRLYRDRHIQLWVVYVDNFNRFKPENWADRTRSLSEMGDHDVLLAVATNTKTYSFTVPAKVQDFTTAELNSLRSNKIEPAVLKKDWSGAAVAAADGLNKSTRSSTRIWLLIAIAVIAAVVLLVVVLLLYRSRRRRRNAQRSDPAQMPPDIGGPVDPLTRALSTADGRTRQISDYVTRHRQNIGSEAKTRLDETRKYLKAAHDKRASNAAEAIADANQASTLAAQAQTLANADVQAAHRAPRR